MKKIISNLFKKFKKEHTSEVKNHLTPYFMYHLEMAQKIVETDQERRDLESSTAPNHNQDFSSDIDYSHDDYNDHDT